MRIPPGWKLNATSVALSLFSGWAVAQPWAIVGHHAFFRANLPEVLPASPIKLAGNVRLETPRVSFSINREGENCGELCAALLDTPGVTSVSMSTTGTPANVAPVVYRLVPRVGDRSRGIFPVEPESILDRFPLFQQSSLPRNFQALSAARRKEKQAVAAGWGVRLASTRKLTAERVNTDPDFTIRITDEQRGENKHASILRVEILDRNSKALLRRSIVTASALSAPLRFDGKGSIENYHVELSRDRLSNVPANSKLEPIPELFRYSSLAPPKPDLSMISLLLDRLRNASRNPATSPDDPDFGLAELWLPTIDWQHPVPSEQLAVLKQVISDPRIAIPHQLYSGYESKVDPELRTALASRIVNSSTPAQTRAQLARLLSRMPPGTFAMPSSNEQEIFSNPELWADSYPMIVRLADQGESAIPSLLAILKSGRMVKPPFRRDSVMHAVALAFAVLGPRAHSALTEVDALISSNRSQFFRDSSESMAWNVALARMGKPIEEFDWSGSRPEFVARQREDLRRQVERFNPKDVWNL
jgi:hypothetical protein